jgi:arginase family enzyme
MSCAPRSSHAARDTCIDCSHRDPSIAPATGTPESGGWSTREVRQLIHLLVGLNIVGFDVVEVRLTHGFALRLDLAGTL